MLRYKVVDELGAYKETAPQDTIFEVVPSQGWVIVSCLDEGDKEEDEKWWCESKNGRASSQKELNANIAGKTTPDSIQKGVFVSSCPESIVVAFHNSEVCLNSLLWSEITKHV